MKQTMLLVLVISARFLLAQDNTPSNGARPDNSKHAKGQTTVQGCVSRSNGDYVLMKQDPANTYELRATGKIRLGQYLGQRVKVTGSESPSANTSSDSLGGIGSAASLTLTVTSIKTIDKECPVHLFSGN
jgi:hypothetical protein